METGDQIETSKNIHTRYRPLTKKFARFFGQLTKWNSKGRKFTKNATKWLKRHKTMNGLYNVDNWNSDMVELLYPSFKKFAA